LGISNLGTTSTKKTINFHRKSCFFTDLKAVFLSSSWEYLRVHFIKRSERSNKMKRYPLLTAVIATLVLLSTLIPSGYVSGQKAVKAFPGAMGFGTNTPGGRGGKVIYVTNLNDSGTGSLRAALVDRSPRVVLFKVAGTITLASDIVVKTPYLTIAGQTAPGQGVQIRGAQIKIATHDVIIRYLKMRTGDLKNNSNPADRDSIALNHDTNAYNIVIDHSTLIWGPDIGGVSFLNGAHDATVSNSILGEGLYVSNHPEGTLDQTGHSLAVNITRLKSGYSPTRITMHHNLLTTSSDRNPRVIGGVNIDIVNNVIYNWRNSASQGNPQKLNLVNNFYIKGPMTTNQAALVAWKPAVEANGTLRLGSIFESGNLTEGFNTVRGGSKSVYVSALFTPYSMPVEDSPQDAYEKIVNDAGANRQVGGADGAIIVIRDGVDQRIINNLVARRGTFMNGVYARGVGGFPAISWPTLATGTPALDKDNDGMPDAWEQLHFGNILRGSPADSKGDFDSDGYTDLEEYLNLTNPTAP
jgi:pectate lyase